MALSDTIETFIKALLTDDAPHVDIRRNELAEYFGCAPSQITYVLATRFTASRGYIIESHRGGNGYVRIVRIHADSAKSLWNMLNERIGSSISENLADEIIVFLLTRQLITEGEARIMRSATADRAIALPVGAKDMLRAGILKSMIIGILFGKKEGTINDM